MGGGDCNVITAEVETFLSANRWPVGLQKLLMANCEQIPMR